MMSQLMHVFVIFGVCVQPMRRYAVGVESGLLSMLTARTVAANSASIIGAKLGRNAVSSSNNSFV